MKFQYIFLSEFILIFYANELDFVMQYVLIVHQRLIKLNESRYIDHVSMYVKRFKELQILN